MLYKLQVVHLQVTVTGDVTVDTDTLKVDATNDQVGVNTTAMNSYYAKDFVVSAANQGGITVVGATTVTHSNNVC